MNGKLNFFPNGNIWLWLSFVGSLITMMLGSITQQDVYQRITSARTQKIALWGSLIGALLYFCFAFLPMFIAYSATIINPEFSANIDAHGSEIILPLFIMQYTTIFAQVIFFGAVISAIMSTSAATLLAPSVMFTENILSEYLPGLTDKKKLLIMRQSLIVFAIAVLIYAFNSELTIFGMVESAYKVTLVGAFTPLIFGIFWKKANDYGALLAIILGVFSWLSLELLFGDHFIVPPQLIGFAFSVFGMLVGSLVFKQDLSKKLIIHT
jgi:Na+/proline symporter